MELKIGDTVIMNDNYYASDRNKDKQFQVTSEPWLIGGTSCVLLKGYSGGYAVDGLTLVEN